MPTPEIIENAVYNDEELAELFDIPYQNMRLIIKRGHICGTKIGKRWFVSGKSLLKVFDKSNEEIAQEEKDFLSSEDPMNDNINPKE